MCVKLDSTFGREMKLAYVTRVNDTRVQAKY